MSGNVYEQKCIEKLIAGEEADTLSVHTSAGVPAAMSVFLEALSKHLPWSEKVDWFCSLQSEGEEALASRPSITNPNSSTLRLSPPQAPPLFWQLSTCRFSFERKRKQKIGRSA